MYNIRGEVSYMKETEIIMRKKIKLKIPQIIAEILNKDISYFGIKKEKLCNLIIQNLGFENIPKVDLRLKTDKTVMLYFNFSSYNTKYFDHMMFLNNEIVETEFTRKIFNYYITQSPFVREFIIKKNLYQNLEEAIRENQNLIIEYKEQILEILPQSIIRCQKTEYNLLQAKVGKNETFYEIKDINILRINASILV